MKVCQRVLVGILTRVNLQPRKLFLYHYHIIGGMSASPGDIVRIAAGVKADSNTAVIHDNSVVGTYLGPAITVDNNTTPITPSPIPSPTTGTSYNFTMPFSIETPQFVEEIVEGTIPSASHGLVWSTTMEMPDPIAIEFKQFIRESNDGRGVLSFTEWACKNCDGAILRKIRDTYHTKYGKNIMFDADSMFWIMDRCKMLEDRLEKVEFIFPYKDKSHHKRTARR
jgi:hypothetical protein